MLRLWRQRSRKLWRCCEIIRQKKVKKLRNRDGKGSKMVPPIQICLVAFEAFHLGHGGKNRVIWIGITVFFFFLLSDILLRFLLSFTVYSIFVLVRVSLLLLFVFSCYLCECLFLLACEGEKLGWCGWEMYLDLLINIRSKLIFSQYSYLISTCLTSSFYLADCLRYHLQHLENFLLFESTSNDL